MGTEARGRVAVEAAVAEVVRAPDTVRRRVVARWAAQLAASAEAAPPAAAEISRSLLAAADGVLGDCWSRGWQPADLARVCTRLQPERTQRPRDARLVVDLMAAQGRRYSAAGLDPRWAGQLDELGVRVWWGDDGAYLAGLVAREAGGGSGVGPAAAVAPDRASRRVLEPVLASWLALMRCLARLPGIALIGPLPGEGSGSAVSSAEAHSVNGAAPKPVEARQLHRVRALLAKAESTTFSEEADALTAKAQQLMSRYSITAALLAGDPAGPGAGGPAVRRLGVDEPYEAPKALLLGAVASANRCRTAWSRSYGFVTVIGFEPDLDAVELLYTSLLVQATGAMTRAGGRRDAAGSSRTKSFRRSFLVAYASRIGQRLDEAAGAAARDAAAGRGAPDLDDADSYEAPVTERDRARLLPVLAAREEEVEGATRKLFPRLVTQNVRVGDAEGWAHGTAAADQAVLSGGRDALRPR